jgi:SAM-dependent methyltransferase
MTAERLTTEAFWDGHWESSGAAGSGFEGYEGRVWSAIFQRTFSEAKPGDKCIEVGCADSRYLPWIAQRHGLAVAGVDYSEAGCRLAEKRLAQAGVTGEIFQRDIFAANDDLAGKFDYVVSFGLVEHFDDPRTVLRAMRRLLKPGGRILTTTPNVTPGAMNVVIYRATAPRILAMHKLMTAAQLGGFHEDAGFTTIESGYAGMGLCLSLDEPTWWRRGLQAAAYRSVQAARRGLECLGSPPRGNAVTGLFMIYRGARQNG